MFEPKYLIRLDKRAFPTEQVVCLGSQLISIIKNLSELIESHIWFCADIDAISPIPQKLGVDSFQLTKIGDDPSLVNLCENIDQFLSGVFIAIREKDQNLKYSDLCVGTEDDQFRSLDLDGVLIEIRAFDTSYFEIYSENQELINKLAKIYSIKIEKLDS
ncbi:MAG: hypothetical protein K1000chlam2_00074 [Chlamydiae bacterium]|nr:hypothetical protein [Chlamydiota bacterium]